MINGTVTDRQAVVTITVFGPVTGAAATVEAVVNTGFDYHLTLPLETVAALALPAEQSLQVMLADGSIVWAPHFRAEIEWHNGERRPISVQAAPNAALIGMGLLENSRLVMDVTTGGAVLIEPLP